MNTLTKEQIQKLSPEQRKDVAELELQRAKTRQRLLDQARSCRSQTIVTVVVVAFVTIPLMWLDRSSFTGSLLLIISIASLLVGTGLQINLTNRRIDALIRLLEHELQETAHSSESGEEKSS